MATIYKRDVKITVRFKYYEFTFDNFADADDFAEKMIKSTSENEDIKVDMNIVYSKYDDDPNETTYIAEDIINRAESREAADHENVEDLMPEEENKYEQFV